MGLSQALTTAISGLTANQAGLALVSSNVANADTPGYVRKTVQQVTSASSGTGMGVRVVAVQRELDTYVQRQLRVENAGAYYADTRAQFYQRLQDVYGTPGSNGALETVYNNFTQALQALATSADDAGARNSVISAAQQLTQRLNQMSQGIQSLRADAELGISDAVARANEAMIQIAELNQRISGSGQKDSTTAMLTDQRDNYIDQLSQLMDINVVQMANGEVSVFTNSGVQLVGTQASQLSFDAQGTMSANTLWSADPSERSVGTITLTSPNGTAIDLLQAKAIRSGTIAAYVQMRDEDLTQAQSQLDALAAAMASALSDKTTDGTAATSGAQSGFDVDIGSLSAGNRITVTYTNALSGTPVTVTFMRVDELSALPLSNDATSTPGDRVVGLDFSNGIASVVSQINSALAATSLTASNPSGTTLRILDDGAGNVVDINALSVTRTATSLSGGSSELPFFTDGSGIYSGAVGGLGSQRIGFAGRIAVNSSLVADPSKLVAYASGVAAGDTTRPDFIFGQLTSAALEFDPATGIGTASTPFTGTITTFLRQVISQQGEAADAASKLKDGQDVVLSALQQRFNDTASVNVDNEMASLLTLQNAYAANARVLSTVKDMFDTLMRM